MNNVHTKDIFTSPNVNTQDIDKSCLISILKILTSQRHSQIIDNVTKGIHK